MANKEKIDSDAAWKMLESASSIRTGKGKKIQDWDPNSDDKLEILKDVIGPSGNYFLLDNGAKWILSLTMIIGRLEIFTVLVLLSMNFWRS